MVLQMKSKIIVAICLAVVAAYYGYSKLSQPKIVAWGDSLTFGVGAKEFHGYPDNLKDDGYDVVKKGFPGQASSDIALRQGGLSPVIKTSFVADGIYSVVSMEPSGDFRKYKEMVFRGRLEGKPVVLFRATNGAWQIKSSSTLNCESGCRFVTSEKIVAKDAINVIWVGRNNNLAFTRFIERDVDLIVTSLPDGNRFVVIGVTPSTNDSPENLAAIKGVNNLLGARYGARFIDMWAVLSRDGVALSGIKPTQSDVAAVSNGMIAPSLYSDNVHLNDSGYKAITSVIENYLNQ